MIVPNRLRVLVALAALLAPLLIPVSTEARTRKGDKLLKLAQKAEDKKDWDAALALYQQALRQDPADPGYMAGEQRVRFQAGQVHVEKAIKLRDQGQLEAALGEFQHAFAIDGSSMIAFEEIKVTSDMIEASRKGTSKAAPLTPVQQANQDSMARIGSLQDVPDLKPINKRITGLTMVNQPPKVLYETVGKLAGINVIIDPTYSQNTKASVDLTNSTLDEALDYVAMVTHTFWKPITSNTIFVADENPSKRRDYEDNVVKVFYLKNVTSPQEFQEIITAVRSVTDIRRIYTYNEQNAAVIRGTPDQVLLAEKLFHDLDKPKAEVVVDIIVLTANSTRTRDLALSIMSQGANGTQAGLSLPIGFNPRSTIASTATSSSTTGGTASTSGIGTTATSAATTAATTLIPLAHLGKINFNDFTTVLPGALLQAMLSDSNTKVLQSPQVRASDGMKVTLKVGQKYPYATGSFQPGVGTVGVSPLVSTQFQFLDTGVDLEMQAHVHGTDEVTLHVDFKLSNVAQTLNLGGLSQPVVAQQTNATDVRVRDGQVTLLGGVLATTDTFSLAGIPGLVNIPVLGKFLGATNHKELDRNELVIAIIPHIVRTPGYSNEDFRGVAAGNDQVVRVIRSEAVDGESAPAQTPAAPAQPRMPSPAPSQQPVPDNTNPAATPPTPTLSFVPGELHARVGAPTAVTLQINAADDLFSAPLQIRWDPKLLQLVSATPGSLLSQGGQMVGTIASIRNQAGEASVPLTRLPGAGGVSGSGPLAVLNFMAIGKGTGTVSITEVGAKNSKLEPLTVKLPELKVVVE